MRTPIYIADKKRSKYAYQALLNLEKAIVMANAYADHNYHVDQPRSGKHLSLKSSIKRSKEGLTPKKKVRIADDQEQIEDIEDHKTMEPDAEQLASRRNQLENLQKLMSLRESIKTSRESVGSFGRAANQAMVSHEDQDEILQQILDQEKDEIRKVEEQLRLSKIEKEKHNKLDHEAQIEKMKRWDVIDQKRDMKKQQRNEALNRDIDPFRVAEELEKQEKEKHQPVHDSQGNTLDDLELSSITDDDEREQKMKEKEEEGKFLTFKRFMNNKKQSESKDEDVVLHRESKPEPEVYNIQIVEEEEEHELESDITDELDFSNQNRSFDKHPLDISHDSKIEEESIRMSRTTLRTIKDRKNKSEGPIGRTFAYLDARSMTQSSLTKIGSFLRRLRTYISENYTSLKEWITSEKAEQKKRKSKSVPNRSKTDKVLIKPSKRLPVEEIKAVPVSKPQQVLKKEPTSKGSSMADIMKKHRTFGKTAQELLFENDDSELNSEDPSVILKRKLAKLKDDERKLKEMEQQIDIDLKDLKGAISTEEIESVRNKIGEKLSTKKKGKKGKKKKKKQNKVHHDMQRMKQDHIKKILNKDIEGEDESSPQHKPIVKDFKSDHDSVGPPTKRPNVEEDKLN